MPSRRTFLTGAGGALTALALSGCGAGRSEPGRRSGADTPWSYRDALGRTITVRRRPRRVVAYISGAAALWDFGVRPVGLYGPSRNADGSAILQAGNIDLAAVRSVGGENYDGLDLERLAGLQPDLVIASLAGPTPKDRWVIKDDIAQIEKICPVYSIQESGSALPQIIAGYATLAERLGAELDSSTIVQARRRFEAAGDDLKAALAAKPGLRVQFAYADKEGFYVASPKFYPTLIWYAQLGMDIARADDPSATFLQQLSWEQVGRYPADLMCIDIRDFSLQPKQIAAQFPTFARLPAVRAGQIGGYNGEPRFSYQQAVAEVSGLASSVRRARVGVAG